MKKIILTSLFITATMLNFAHTSLEGKIFERLIFRTVGCGADIIINSAFFLVLTFEKDSVLISNRAERIIRYGGTKKEEELTELGRFFYRKINQVVKIEGFRENKNLPEVTFVLAIEDDGQTLVEKPDEFGRFITFGTTTFRFKGLAEEKTTRICTSTN